MVKRRYAKRAKPRRRRRSYFTSIRRKKPKIPFEVVITGAAIPFTLARDGYSSTPMQDIERGDWEHLMNNLKDGFTPISFDGQVDIMGYLNPFNLNNGRYMKMLLYAGLASKIRKKFVQIPFDRVPLIGKYIS